MKKLVGIDRFGVPLPTWETLGDLISLFLWENYLMIGNSCELVKSLRNSGRI